MKKLTEGLNYHDLVGQVEPKITIDEYAAKMGKDADIVTVTFVVNSKMAAKDLTTWLELGYDFVLDASVSSGEIVPGKYLVFMELKRRSACVNRIIEVLKDLETLTNLALDEWSVSVDDEEHSANEEELKKAVSMYPQEYRDKVKKQKEIDEFREIAGLEVPNKREQDSEIKDFKAIAGL